MNSGGGPYGASFPNAVAGVNARDPSNRVVGQLGSKVFPGVALELWTRDGNNWYRLMYAPPGLPGWWQLKWSSRDGVPAACQFSTDEAPEGAGQFWMPAGCYVGGGPVNYIGYGLAPRVRVVTGEGCPRVGTWAKGDRVLNTNPAIGGFAGWICVTAGSPGTWAGFGRIESLCS